MSKGIIIINPYLVPKESVHQAERLKEEFNKLGVEVDIVTDSFLQSILTDGNIVTKITYYSFCIVYIYI